MAIREILKEGEEILRKKSRPVTDFNDRLHGLLDDMAQTLEGAGGKGLAAPQVGFLRRAVVIFDDEDEVLELINPEIIETEGEQHFYEGCLSLPGLRGETIRPEMVRVRAQDRMGNPFERSETGVMAVCVCHEIDHLNGVLYRDVALGPLWKDEE